MITPEYLNNIIKGVENRLSENNEYLIRHIAKHIGDSFDKKENNILMPSTIRDLYKLKDSGMVLDDIQKEVEKLLPDIRKEIKQAFLDSADEISKYETDFSRKIIKTLDNHGQPVDVDIPDFEKEGIPKSAKDLNMTAMEIRQLERIYRKTQEEVSNLCHTIPSAGQTAYINACERAYMKAQSGISPNTAIIESIEEMAQEGIKVVNYDSGHVDRIEVAVARAVRSGINKANSEIVLTRCAEMGVGYVKVSAHLGARVTGTQDYRDHAHWQGKVYKLDFNNPELKKYVPTPQDEERNRQDGFGWFDDVKKAIGNDTMFEESTLYSDENRFTEELNEKLLSFVDSIDEKLNHKPIKLDEINPKHRDNIYNIINLSPIVTQNLVNNIKEKILFVNEKILGTAHVTDNKISCNLFLDKSSNYKKTFHEIGHIVDEEYGDLSLVLPQFKQYLYDDFNQFVNEAKKLYNIQDDKIIYKRLSEGLLNKKEYDILSDLFGGMTNNKCAGIRKHPDDYWKDGNLEKEAFAHFFSSTIRQAENELKVLQEFFPNSYKMFVMLIEAKGK